MYNQNRNQRIKALLTLLGGALFVLLMFGSCEGCDSTQYSPPEQQDLPGNGLGNGTGNGTGNRQSLQQGNKGGIQNAGNTCFMNSALQIIAKFFPRLFENLKAPFHILKESGKKIVAKIKNDTAPVTRDEGRAFRELLAQIVDNRSSAYFPRGRMRYPGEQQCDGGELFTDLLESSYGTKKDRYGNRPEVYLLVCPINKTGTDEYFEEETITQLIVNDIRRKKHRDESFEIRYQEDMQVTIDEEWLCEILNTYKQTNDKIKDAMGRQNTRDKILKGAAAQKALKDKFEELLPSEPPNEKEKKKGKEKRYTTDEIREIKTVLLNAENKNTSITYVTPYKRGFKENGTKKHEYYIKPTKVGDIDHCIQKALTDKDLLSVRVKRFTETNQRINTKILNPLNLTIPSSIQEVQGGADLKYKLEGFIRHIGRSVESGHYTAYCKKNGQWKCYNDSLVSGVDESAAKKAAEDGYVYIYRKYNPSN